MELRDNSWAETELLLIPLSWGPALKEPSRSVSYPKQHHRNRYDIIICNRATNLGPCLALVAFSSKGSFTCLVHCNTVTSILKDRYPRATLGFGPVTQWSSNLCTAALTTAPLSLSLSLSVIHKNRPVRIRVRISPPHPLVCRKRRLNGDPWGSGLEQILHIALCAVRGDWMGMVAEKTECHSRCCRIKKGPKRRA
jgi:hypothetical protein